MDNPSCLIPRFDGAILSEEWKLHDPVDRQVMLASPRGVLAVRVAIQRSQAALATLSRELGTSYFLHEWWLIAIMLTTEIGLFYEIASSRPPSQTGAYA
ncbi:hypothetical protein AB4874_09700 [Thioclava sp. 15-R06ZXC-3]|uniref:Uncharacterized protein n=1 Tax=Thioclava arctica TaxID=3238301 RepID=A0ABV3TK04_9RHOB